MIDGLIRALRTLLDRAVELLAVAVPVLALLWAVDAVLGVPGSFFSRLVRLAVVLVAIGVAYLVLREVFDRVTGRDTSDRPVAWRDVRVLALAAQVVALGLIYVVFGYLWTNFRNRTDDLGLNFSFDFLDQPANITIADNPLIAGDTVRIILVGVPLALILGTLVGIARLSTNWLVRKIATGYVELVRNIPPLVVIVFVWQGIFLNPFPPSRESWKPLGEWFVFNNSRFAIPSIKGLDNFGAFQVIVLVALAAAVAVWVWRTRVFNLTGRPHKRTAWSLGTLFGIALVGFVVLGGPFEVSKPLLDEAGRVYTDGFRMQMPYAALMIALVLYTATHIAEIVRGSILSVHKGQVEAANALALNGIQRYRFVILPQAMRVAWPPLINQFLNYTKNTSLGIAVGFAEVTAVTNNLFGQSQPAPQLILLLMASYLVLSLLISVLGNLVNRRLQIVGR